MNGRRSQGIRDDTPKEDIRYYLVSLPEEHFSFLLASESQTDEVSIENLVS
ncbi:MAG: hypothetical protein LBH96_02950 [Candidatus Peribacteria bacterium]|nr:hypothetical protein [Candidatus Peribacteria bacterium]